MSDVGFDIIGEKARDILNVTVISGHVSRTSVIIG